MDKDTHFSDHGVGVPEEKLPYIFDEFYRADESRNRREGNVCASNEDGFTISMTFPLLDETKTPQKTAEQ